MQHKSLDKDKFLSLVDIARHFNLPESTARYYCKRFAMFLPIHGEGRRKRYGQGTLEVVAAILEHMKSGKNANAVEKALSQTYARTMDFSVPALHESSESQIIQSDSFDATLAFKLLEQQTSALHSIAQSLNILTTQQQRIEDLTFAASEATSENIKLKAEVAALKTVIQSAEAVHQDDLDQVRTWMSRLARSYNAKEGMDTTIPQEKKEPSKIKLTIKKQ